ncbi:MAG: hypothetical protein FJ290_07935 [Planctomycetes bacterium]|nr:hypothetical protein [Planctomycetota bacterium]
MNNRTMLAAAALMTATGLATAADGFPKPYSPPCVERENVFAFAERPSVRSVGSDRYQIAFALKGNCDVTVAVVDAQGGILRHLASGVLGPNAPAPFQKNSLKQTLHWDGKDDLGVYVKEPGRMQVRVMLGLKPEFDKLLGPTDPKALPGHIWGIAADADGVYVFVASGGRTHISCRQFDHDAKYVKEVYPPPAALPPEKLGGMGYIEYEPGRRAIQAPIVACGMWRDGYWFPAGFDGGGHTGLARCRPAAANGRIYLLNSGFPQKGRMDPQGRQNTALNMLHYLRTDGATEYAGLAGKEWFSTNAVTGCPSLAAAPDGRTIYLAGLHRSVMVYGRPSAHVLVAGPVDGDGRAKVIVGSVKDPGSGTGHLNSPTDVACDAAGRVYVADSLNNRVQAFAPDGKFLKTLSIERPSLVQVHQKTGEVYVMHQARREGKSISRLTRCAAFPDLSPGGHWDDLPSEVMTLDSWAPKPRIWVSGQLAKSGEGGVSFGPGVLLRVYEIDGGELRIVSDFEEDARAAAGASYMQWPGGIVGMVACDPVRERVVYENSMVFDLRTGVLLGPAALRRHSAVEIAFDKKGHMHIRHGNHDAPKNVVRVDPGRVVDGSCVEVPYDYGVEWNGYSGALPMPATDTQFYSWGMGVNMRGELAALHVIGYSPKFQDEVDGDLGSYYKSGRGIGVWVHDVYGDYMRHLRGLERKGEELFFVRPRPGIELTGGVVWSFEPTGKLRNREAVLIGQYRSNGVQVDEDGYLYFTNGRQRYLDGKLFLRDRGGNFGGPPLIPRNAIPFTGTYIKAAPGRAVFRVRNPRVAADDRPSRPPDLAASGLGAQRIGEGGADLSGGHDTWAEGVEWMYAGASPIVGEHCSCPHMRAALDWFKRSFVPEAYRHSVAVLDTNGNLICHVGQYGNADSARGPGSPVPVGGDGIAMTRGAFVSATDNYLCISDWGHRLIVARLDYHAEETVAVPR